MAATTSSTVSVRSKNCAVPDFSNRRTTSGNIWRGFGMGICAQASMAAMDMLYCSPEKRPLTHVRGYLAVSR